MSSGGVRGLLPWEPPFVMVDAVVECVPHEKVVAVKRVSANDPMTRGHEPRGGVLPAAMVLEGLSQAAALLYQLTYRGIEPSRLPMLGHMDARECAPAHPGDTIIYTVRAVKMTSTSGIFHGIAEVGGAPIAEAELGFSVPEAAP